LAPPYYSQRAVFASPLSAFFILPVLFGHVVKLDDHTPAHRALSQVAAEKQELAPALVLVGGDGQDARAIHGSSRSAMVHPSAFVPNGPRLIVVATLG